MGLTGQNQPGMFGQERSHETERDLAEQVTRSRHRRAAHRVCDLWYRMLFRRSTPSS